MLKEMNTWVRKVILMFPFTPAKILNHFRSSVLSTSFLHLVISIYSGLPYLKEVVRKIELTYCKDSYWNFENKIKLNALRALRLNVLTCLLYGQH